MAVRKLLKLREPQFPLLNMIPSFSIMGGCANEPKKVKHLAWSSFSQALGRGPSESVEISSLPPHIPECPLPKQDL